jgi:hypothetical protein
MDEPSSSETAMDNTLSEPDGQLTPSRPETGIGLHPVIANAAIVEDDPTPEDHILQQTSVSNTSIPEINEDTDLDIFYDLSHVSHDHQTAISQQEELPADDNDAREDLSDKLVEGTGQEQPPGNEEVQSLAEVEVWDVVDDTGNHIVATVDPDEVVSDESAIIDEETSDAVITATVNNGIPDLVDSDEQPSSNEEAPIWLVVVALTIWCCFLIVLIGFIYILVHSTNWDGILTAVALPLFHLSDGFSLTPAKGVDFAAGAIIAPAFIGFANFTWFKIGRRLSPKTNATTEMLKEDAGSFNISKILGLVKTSKPKLILLAILLFSSAAASTLLSNVLGYKAIPADLPEKAQSISTELLYQIVYIPSLLLPALCAVTSASTAAFLLVVLEWRSVLSHRKQVSEQAKFDQGIATDEHDIGCENATTRAHDYVSFPRLRTGRRLFSRGGIEIFRGTSGDGETEPLLQRTPSQVESRATAGSWRLPSFQFPAFTSGRKVSDIEAPEEVTGVLAEQSVETPRSILSKWKLPHLSLPIWSRTQSPLTTVQPDAPPETSSPISAPPNTPAVEYVRKGRKFWKLPTYGTAASVPTTEATLEATQSSSVLPAGHTATSLWALPFPGRFLWPSGNWRTERRNRQQEEASETSSLLSQVEPEQVTLPHVARTSSFWTLPSSTGHYAAPGSKVLSKAPPLLEDSTSTDQAKDRSDVTSYASESWRSWMLPRISFLSSRTVSSEVGTGGISAIPPQTDANFEAGITNTLHGVESTRSRKSHKKQYSTSSFSWFPSFKFPIVVTDIPHSETERPILLPAFDENSSNDVSSSSKRALTASEALNIAIGNQSRSGGMTGQLIQNSSKEYTTNVETMDYDPEAIATSSNERVENVQLSGNSSKRPAVASKVDLQHPTGRSASWMHLPLFTTKRKGNKSHKPSQPIMPMRYPDDGARSPAPPPATARLPTKKGKEREQYVDQFESTIEHVHVPLAPVVIHDESVVMQPTRLEADDDGHQKANLGIGWTPWSSRRSRSDDMEVARTHRISPSRSPSPLRKVAWAYIPGAVDGSPSNSVHPSQDQASWKGWTWWDVSWPHLVDIDNSRPASTNASSRQVSASSKISVNVSKTPDLEAQKQTPESRQPDLGSYRKRPLWGLGRVTYQLPQLSPLSVVLPGYSSPVPSILRTNVQEPEQGEASSRKWYSPGTQLLIEGSKGKEPMKQESTDSWPRHHEHHFQADQENEIWAEGEGSTSSRRRDKNRRHHSQESERSVRKQGGEVDTELSAEMKGYLGL